MKTEHPRLLEIEREKRELFVRIGELDAERTRILLDQMPVKVGDVVRATQYAGLEMLVRAIHSQYGWIIASPRKPDGTWSKVHRQLFTHWEKIE